MFGSLDGCVRGWFVVRSCFWALFGFFLRGVVGFCGWVWFWVVVWVWGWPGPTPSFRVIEPRRFDIMLDNVYNGIGT